MSRIFWDTNLFVYLFEGDARFSPATIALRKRMLERRDELVTSAMTLGEIQAGPIKGKNRELARRYCETIEQSCTVVPFDNKAAAIYAELRGTSAVRPPDAIQLSCAAALGVELFVTNDAALAKVTVVGIHFITSLDRLPF
jgi:predicted nucleic acid-binding protein